MNTEMNTIELVGGIQGVETYKNDTSYVIHVTEDNESGILGVCKSKEEAVEIVKSMGTSMLKDLKKKCDSTWTNFEVVSESLVFCIQIQKLGRVRNGSFETYATVKAEMAQNIFPGTPMTIQDELKAHPLSSNLKYY